MKLDKDLKQQELKLKKETERALKHEKANMLAEKREGLEKQIKIKNSAWVQSMNPNTFARSIRDQDSQGQSSAMDSMVRHGNSPGSKIT